MGQNEALSLTQEREDPLNKTAESSTLKPYDNKGVAIDFIM